MLSVIYRPITIPFAQLPLDTAELPYDHFESRDRNTSEGFFGANACDSSRLHKR